jgi:hypothetical protein
MFDGQMNLVNGQVAGGSIVIGLNNNDQYTWNITPNSGAVQVDTAGGWRIWSLARNGLFSDAQFGNVNVAPWFNVQGLNGQPGAFRLFNLNPNAQGSSNPSIDYFVDAAPLPPAAWTGLATLAGAMLVGRLRRRRLLR